MNRFALKFVPLLILCSLLVSLPKINVVRASGTIYIRADGSVEGTNKIQGDGNIYTLTENLYDEIVVERDNIVVDGAGYTLEGTGSLNSVGIGLTGRTNVTIRNIETREFYYGIGLWTSSNNTISGNNITANTYSGVCLYYESSHNSICGNNITNNHNGIWLIGSSNYNRICENKITANELDGITLSDSIYNSIFNNNIRANERGGIGLYFSSSINSIRRNNITNNQYGIELYDFSNHNSISENNIANNNRSIWLFKSSFTSIYHNNFVNNTKGAATLSSVLNIWDDDYPSGGNYWSNYTGVDLYSGQYQNEAGRDGIGDTVHLIDDSNQDNYPLKGPISFFNACTWDETTYDIHTVSNSTFSDFNFSEDDKLIGFNVTGPDDTVGFCRVAIPRDLMWCDSLEEWTVTVNTNSPTYLKAMDDADHTYLYFTYNHTIHNVKITSIYVIPEIPTRTSILLILIVLTVAIRSTKED